MEHGGKAAPEGDGAAGGVLCKGQQQAQDGAQSCAPSGHYAVQEKCVANHRVKRWNCTHDGGSRWASSK